MIAENESSLNLENHAFVAPDDEVEIDRDLTEILNREFMAVIQDVRAKSGEERAESIDSLRAVKAIQQIEDAIMSRGRIPSFAGQREIIASIFESAPISGLGDWRLTAKYGALLAIERARNNYLNPQYLDDLKVHELGVRTRS